MSVTEWWEKIGPEARANIAPLRDDGYCHCPNPLTDEVVGLDTDTDDDWCWRCSKPLPETSP